MSYDDHKKLALDSSFDEQRIYWIRCIEEKTKNIERTKKYASNQDFESWDIFFQEQHTILTNYSTGYWPLQNPFIWNLGVPSRVPTNQNQSLDNI